MLEKPIDGQLEFNFPPKEWTDPEEETEDALEIEPETIISLGYISVH